MEEIKSISSTTGKGDKKVESRISVEEIANGFLIIENKDYKNAKGEYKYETTKTFSKTNPLGEKAVSSLKAAMLNNMPGSKKAQ